MSHIIFSPWIHFAPVSFCPHGKKLFNDLHYLHMSRIILPPGFISAPLTKKAYDRRASGDCGTSGCYLTSYLHHPASLYREGSICEEDILRYSFRTEVQPRSHRLADLWPLTSKSNTHLFYRSCFKYGVRRLNTQHFHSYCSSKNVLFVGQNDLDPRTIDLNLNLNLAIEILYQYEYVAQVERLNYGTITACLRKGSVFRCKIK